MNYMTRMIASLCWHQASACHLVFQIALIPAWAGPHHLVHCKMPLLQYCKAFWAALLEGGPFCFQGHPHFQETALQKGCSAPPGLYLQLSIVRTVHHFSLLTDQWSCHCPPPHDQHYFLVPTLLLEDSCTPWHDPQWASPTPKGFACFCPNQLLLAARVLWTSSFSPLLIQFDNSSCCHSWGQTTKWSIPRYAQSTPQKALLFLGGGILYHLTRKQNYLTVSRQIP